MGWFDDPFGELEDAVKDVADVITDPVNAINPGAGVTKKAAVEAAKALTPEFEQTPDGSGDAPPSTSDAAVQAAADAERKRAALAGGRASTILTGGRGLMEPAPVARKVLLGQ